MKILWPFRRKADPVRLRQRAADLARDRGDWAQAATDYAVVAAAWPHNVSILVQYGHALKESGDPKGAERAYRAAARLAPTDADIPMQLAHLLRRTGEREAAAAAYGEALAIDPTLRAAIDALADMGGRAHLPDGFQGRARFEQRLARLTGVAEDLSAAIDENAASAVFPTGRYDLFRTTFPIAPPPPTGDGRLRMRIWVDASAAHPHMLRATLESLRDQRGADWSCVVAAPAALAGHPVGSFAAIDPRIAFGAFADVGVSGWDSLISVPAGVKLDPEALGWFAYALRRTGAAVVYADHDRRQADLAGSEIGLSPTIMGVFDPDVLAASNDPPVVVAIASDTPAGALAEAHLANGGGYSPAERHRRLLLAAASHGRVVHLPRILSSAMLAGEATLNARPTEAEVSISSGELPWGPTDLREIDGPNGPIVLQETHRRDGRPVLLATSPAPRHPGLAVIIPTRDEPDLLRACVESLIATAAYPDRLEFLIVDNRSRDPRTSVLLAEWARTGVARTIAFDEPFNWSRVNNLAAGMTTAEHLLFVNNDTSMETAGWDSLLDGYLDRPDVGIVGARLLYPDRTIQHAGILFAVKPPALSVHEGLGYGEKECGPGDRWGHTRSVSAITGAFLAVRRDRFEAIGMFDETLFVAYNDIDLCLRARSEGLIVMYAPAITLVHFESRTRGINQSRAQVAWDDAERHTLARRWGDALELELSCSPYWAKGGAPFDGYREPPLGEILRHLDQGALSCPWRIGPKA